MSVENQRIHRYQYEFHTALDPKRPGHRAVVYLYGKQDALLAAIAFVDDDIEPATPEISPNGFVSAQMPLSTMSGVIDMLRNERPVIFSWSEGSSVVRITTQDEPVGEQELKRLFRFLYI